MQFTATLVAAILAVGASATVIPKRATSGDAQCMPIMDKGQTILTTDCELAVKQLREITDRPCNRMLSHGATEYITVGTCKVQTDGNGSQQCAEPAIVADGLQKLVDSCRNQWGFMDTSRVTVEGSTFATAVLVAEVETTGPVRTPWDNE